MSKNLQEQIPGFESRFLKKGTSLANAKAFHYD